MAGRRIDKVAAELGGEGPVKARSKAALSIEAAAIQSTVDLAALNTKDRWKLPRLPLPKAGIGPAALTDELVAVICDLISESVPLNRAAMACGLNDDTLSRWLQQGADDFGNAEPSRFALFYVEVHRACVEEDVNLLRALKLSKAGDWQKYAWILERTRSDFYALRKDKQGIVDAAAALGDLFAQAAAAPSPYQRTNITPALEAPQS